MTSRPVPPTAAHRWIDSKHHHHHHQQQPHQQQQHPQTHHHQHHHHQYPAHEHHHLYHQHQPPHYHLQQQQQQQHLQYSRARMSAPSSVSGGRTNRTTTNQNKPDVIPSPTMSGSPRGKVSNQFLLDITDLNYPKTSMPASSPNTSSSQSSNQSQSGEQLSKTNLYIRGLSKHTTDKDLLAMCESYGKITSTKAIIDSQLSTCKGYGFVDFETPQAAEYAVQELQASGFQAQMAKVIRKREPRMREPFPTRDHGMPKPRGTTMFGSDAESSHVRKMTSFGGQQEQDPTNLYIANLPPYFTEEHLENLFKEYGTVISTRILRKLDGQSRGVGFARMESKEKCEQIIQNFNSKILAGGNEPLLVKFADGGSKKKAQYQQNRSWTERADANNYSYVTGIPVGYDQSSIAQNGLYLPYSVGAAPPGGAAAAGGGGAVATAMIPAGIMPRYSMSTTPVTTYQVQSTNPGWMHHPQYIMPPIAHMIPNTVHPGSHTLDPTSVMPTLTTQMGQLQLSSTSYVSGPHATYTQIPYQPQGGTVVQTVPVEVCVTLHKFFCSLFLFNLFFQIF
ncbi:RNA-binding motif, single-stranded-interacting protein 3 isoform X3 [Octopus bimaculoides]|uniref:RNA-binding motif, single-stranded-interacting protein 3 isoform X3 n=1 Tax=Octopus bimaculoides TaxID=37653 RepID=UPI0022E7ED12|nr:RNA-binding motif, single-stranded-interacting protein 3 isoform X3 [Octopus bimaculoides]